MIKIFQPKHTASSVIQELYQKFLAMSVAECLASKVEGAADEQTARGAMLAYREVRERFAKEDLLRSEKTQDGLVAILNDHLKNLLDLRDPDLTENMLSTFPVELRNLAEHIAQERIKIGQLRVELLRAVLSFVGEWRFDVRCAPSLIRLFPFLEPSSADLSRLIEWALGLDDDDAVANALGQCLEQVEEKIFDIRSSVLLKLTAPSVRRRLQRHAPRLYDVFADRHEDAWDRIWRRGRKRATITWERTEHQMWKANDVSLGGAWAEGCREEYGKSLGMLWVRFEGGDRTIIVDSAFVAERHANNPPIGRGIRFAQFSAENKKQLFNSMSKKQDPDAQEDLLTRPSRL